jgi:hypothetical protein
MGDRFDPGTVADDQAHVGAAVPPARRRRRALLGVGVLAGAAAAVVLLTRGATPAFPPNRDLAARGYRVAAVAQGDAAFATLDSQEAISAASAYGLGGPEGAPRLVQLTMRGFYGLAWEVASTDGYLRVGGRHRTGRWEVVLVAARGGKLLARLVIP